MNDESNHKKAKHENGADEESNDANDAGKPLLAAVHASSPGFAPITASGGRAQAAAGRLSPDGAGSWVPNWRTGKVFAPPTVIVIAAPQPLWGTTPLLASFVPLWRMLSQRPTTARTHAFSLSPSLSRVNPVLPVHLRRAGQCNPSGVVWW